MIEIYPSLNFNSIRCPSCGGELTNGQLHWQGIHICTDTKCKGCSKTYIADLPVNQASILYRILEVQSGNIFDENAIDITQKTPWYNDRIKAILNPSLKKIEINIEKRLSYSKVIILNTVDFVYGHSLLFLFNLQRLINKLKGTEVGIIVIIQPMMKWLIPDDNIAEIWTVNLKFNELNLYYLSLSDQINKELRRFEVCFLSRGHVLPTNEKIDIEKFTKISKFSYLNRSKIPRITFVWREDAGRLWIRNIYLLKIFQKLNLSKIILPIHLFRVKFLFYLLKKDLKGIKYQFTVAGLGSYGRFASYIEDKRVKGFSDQEEKDTCKAYAESELVIGVHGSSMLLPSAHAGMTISMMPTKRWGNFGEDIISNSEDTRVSSFQQRVIPLNLSIFEIADICLSMIKGRDYFIKKFNHKDEL